MKIKTMKYKVFVRGQKEPLITEDSFVQEEFNNYMQFKKNKVIQIGNWNGKVSDIKYIQEEKDENDWREKYEQYNRERRERAKRSPEEKQKVLRMDNINYILGVSVLILKLQKTKQKN
jgi:hypothetical protein